MYVCMESLVSFPVPQLTLVQLDYSVQAKYQFTFITKGLRKSQKKHEVEKDEKQKDNNGQKKRRVEGESKFSFTLQPHIFDLAY